MKLATLKDGSRDGQLVVVSRDLTRAVKPGFVKTMQAALDDWDNFKPKLDLLYADLNEGKATDAFEFDQTKCESPLPRAYQWADGSAYVNHVELVRKARGAEMPESFWTDPLMYQAEVMHFLGRARILRWPVKSMVLIWKRKLPLLLATFQWEQLQSKLKKRFVY